METREERNARYLRLLGITYDELARRLSAVQSGEYRTHADVMRETLTSTP